MPVTQCLGGRGRESTAPKSEASLVYSKQTIQVGGQPGPHRKYPLYKVYVTEYAVS